MPVQRFRDATTAEIDRLARTLCAARVVESRDELLAIHQIEPWRIQIDGHGDVALLGRWRDHLPYLAIESLWCPAKRTSSALGHIRRIGSEHGYTDVVSSPTPVEDMHIYEAAGMHPHTVVVTYQLDRLIERSRSGGLEGLTVRTAEPADGPALLGVDARCFDSFWRYDARHLVHFFTSARLAIAERHGEPLGYTLCTVNRGEGLLGRLCVVPEWRRMGVGSALIGDAVRYVREQGGEHVMLSTQTDNALSQALYRQANFHDTGRRYAFLRFGRGEA